MGATNVITKYGNRLNDIPLRRFNAREMNLFFTIVARVREKGTEKVVLTFDELRDLSKYTQHGEKLVQDLSKTYDKLLKLSARTDDGVTISRFVVFTQYEINRETKTVTIRVNPIFKGLFNELKYWTRFNLEQFADLKSTYSKTMFRLLKQWRTVGLHKFSMEEFRFLLDVPESYSVSDIDKQVLSYVREELSPIFKGLSIKKTRGGRGGKITGYRMTWKPEIKAADDFKHVTDQRDALFAIQHNADLTEDEKARAIDRVLDLPLDTTKNSASVNPADYSPKFKQRRVKAKKSVQPAWADPNYVAPPAKEASPEVKAKVAAELEKLRENQTKQAVTEKAKPAAKKPSERNIGAEIKRDMQAYFTDGFHFSDPSNQDK